MQFSQQILPAYTIGPDAYSNIPNVCNLYGNKAAVCGGERALAAVLPRLKQALNNSGIEMTGSVWTRGEASIENAAIILRDPVFMQADYVLACGGGKAIDLMKYVCCIAKKPIFACPTIAATCAATSACAILYEPDGMYRETFQPGRPPAHTFIDTVIIAQAPPVYLWTGIGDTLAKHFETTFASTGRVKSFTDTLGLTLGVECYRPLVAYAEKAYQDCKAGDISPELEQVLLTVVVTTGIVSNLMSERYCCSLAHALLFGLDVLPQVEKRHLHGEVVSYGLLCLLTLWGRLDVRDELYALYKKIELPTCLSDLEVTKEELTPVLDKFMSLNEATYIPADMILTREATHRAILALEDFQNV